MRVLFQLGICVGGQHFAVSIDVYALVLCLFKELLKIIEVVTRNDDERTFFHGKRHFRGSGVTVGLGVCPVKKLHTSEIYFAHLHHNGEQLVHSPVVHTNCEKGFAEECIYSLVSVAKHISVICIRRHSSYAEKDKGFKGTDIRFCVPQLLHIVIIGSAAGGGAHGAVGDDTPFLRFNAFGEGIYGFVIEVNIGNSCEKSLNKKLVSLGSDKVLVAAEGTGKTYERACEPVLKQGSVSLFSANACAACTACAASGLFTLKTKHLIHIGISLLFLYLS